MDYKDLTRTTKSGYVAILFFICSSSSWPILVLVEDFSALTAAQNFFQHVVSFAGVPEKLLSDRGSSFSSKFFQYLMKLLKKA